jgi:hypothetical protein
MLNLKQKSDANVAEYRWVLSEMIQKPLLSESDHPPLRQLSLQPWNQPLRERSSRGHVKWRLPIF